MKQLYEICYGTEPSDKELALLEIKKQRLLDNGYTDQDANKILLDNNLSLDNYEWSDSIIQTNDDTIYRHYKLQIHSLPGGFDPETGKVIKRPYYLEMKQRFTINELLNYYYEKLIIPMEFRDIKRDIGAFNHLIASYKFSKINTVDFLLFVIDYMSSNEYKSTNPLDLKNYAQVTYEYLEQYVLCTRLEIKNREEVLLNEM